MGRDFTKAGKIHHQGEDYIQEHWPPTQNIYLQWQHKLVEAKTGIIQKTGQVKITLSSFPLQTS